MILKKGLLTELEKKKQKKQDSQKDNNIFWVGPVFGGALKTNIFKVGLTWKDKKLKLTDINLRDNNCWRFL